MSKLFLEYLSYCCRHGSVDKERNKKDIVADPLADLNKLEKYFSFCIKETYSLDRDSGKVC